MKLSRGTVLTALGSAAAAVAAPFGPASAASGEALPPALSQPDAMRRRQWNEIHEEYVRLGLGERPRAIFLGDSLTYGWLATGRPVFDIVYRPRRVLAFGIGGDRTADLLWRIRHGELSGPAPYAVAMMIGTNDLRYGGQNALRGIVACVEAARTAAPSATLLLLGLLPRGSGGPDDALRLEITGINQALAALDDGRHVRFLDMGYAFVHPNGNAIASLYEPDLVHLSLRGYDRWARTMAPLFDGILSSKT